MEDASRLPTASEQKERIAYLQSKAKKKQRAGSSFFIIAAAWYREWQTFADEKTDSPPGPIDNSAIIGDKEDKVVSCAEIQLLKEDVLEGQDFVIISNYEWKQLVRWYKGGPKIERQAYQSGKILKVEVHFLQLKVILSDKDGTLPDKPKHTKQFSVSRFTTVQKLTYLVVGSTEWHLHPLFIRLWSYEDSHTFALLDNDEATLESVGIADNEVILVEVKTKKGWPREKKTKKKFFGLISKGELGSATALYPKGICGLRNLGNTCYMNSSLQCLNNTPDLTEYFCRGTYKSHVNKTNPLGMKGQVAEGYAALCKEMWSGSSTSITPKNFRSTICKFATQFEGMSQHDSQEFLGFILDGLHEDLNRVTEKPYIVAPETDGRIDADVAEEAWQGHLKRHQSVIVELFQGQLKSKVQCPDCDKVSTTFDPFMFLSLPLTEESKRGMEVTLVKMNDMKNPFRYWVQVDAIGNIKDLKRALIFAADIPEGSRLVCCEIMGHRFYEIKKDNAPLAKVGGHDMLFFYEISEASSLRPFKLIQRRHKVGYYSYMGTELCGLPLIINFDPLTTTWKDLYNLIWRKLNYMIKKGSGDSSYSQSSSSSSTDSEDSQDGYTDHQIAERKKEKENRKLQIKIHALDKFDPKGDLDYSLPWYLLPFYLCHTNTNGTTCRICDKKSCKGCRINPSDDPVEMCKGTICVHWAKWIQRHFYDSTESDCVILHKSVVEARRLRQVQTSVDIDRCLQLFTTTEKLSENDMWYCPRCGDHKQATKRMQIWKLPKVLIIHLKRFQYTRQFREKLSVDVDFPLTDLDLSKYVINEHQQGAKYELYAVSNHMGGMGGGHYTAYCRNMNDGKWYHFNDSSVHPIKTPSTVKTANAYVLYYVMTTSPSYIPFKDEVEVMTIPNDKDEQDQEQKNGEDDTEGKKSGDNEDRRKDKDKNGDDDPKGKDKKAEGGEGEIGKGSRRGENTKSPKASARGIDKGEKVGRRDANGDKNKTNDKSLSTTSESMKSSKASESKDKDESKEKPDKENGKPKPKRRKGGNKQSESETATSHKQKT